MQNSISRRQLENVAINSTLPLKATRRCAIANVECFGGSGILGT